MGVHSKDPTAERRVFVVPVHLGTVWVFKGLATTAASTTGDSRSRGEAS